MGEERESGGRREGGRLGRGREREREREREVREREGEGEETTERYTLFTFAFLCSSCFSEPFSHFFFGRNVY